MELSELFVKTELQEIFDHVVEHLAKQGVQSLQGKGCCYRTDDGRSCAIGCLITAERYTALGVGRYEGRGVDGLLDSLDVQVSNRIANLLIRLQTVHDASSTRWGVCARLRDAATGFQLSAAAVDAHMPDEWCDGGGWRAYRKEQTDETE